MEPMKISFGFSKRTKTTNITSNNFKKDDKKLELIECLEGQSIKVKDAVEEVAQPLIIPLKDNQKNLLDRIKAARNRDKSLEQKKEEPEDTRPDSELSPDELAARQLIREAKARLASGYSANDSKVSVLPISEDPQSQEGEKEPTLEDYDSVPISDYGLALLRGMGWKEGMAIGKNTSKLATVSVPELRPKGLGLGATKVLKSEMPTSKAVDRDGNELILVKGCCAKIIAGPHKGNYCEVQGFDEEAGRVIVKIFPKGEIVNMNELLLLPVTKDEFSKGSKIINNAKYEEYKEMSDKKLDNYRLKSEASELRHVKEKSTIISDSDEDGKLASKNEKKLQKSRYKSESPHRDYGKTSKNYNTSKSRSKSNEKNRHSSHYKSKRDHSASSSSSNEEYNKSSHSKSNREKKVEEYSSDEDYYEKDKKSKKHTKSKNRDRSRSKERSNKNKKHYRHNRESSDDDKKEKRKKNKCKSRHRRNSSSSSEDRRYKSKR